jgi:glycosyltransferase involved in cell wall biosynthesis
MTHRADELFERVLAGVTWAAEVIVADHGQNLDWQPLKQHFDFQVIKASSEAITDFGAARNRLLKHATQPWVFFLDSDEVLQPFDVTELQVLIAQPRVAAATIKRVDIFYDQPLQYGEVGRVEVMRLARRPAIHFRRPVHEVAEIEGLKGTVASSQLVVWHYAHPSISEFLQKVSAYSRLEAYSRPLPAWWQLWLELWLLPWGKFVVNYLFKKGYKDGWRGLTYALMMSIHSLSVRAFLAERKQHDQRS